MTKAEKAAADNTAAVAEISRRMAIEAAANAKPCHWPFCINKRYHLHGSGKCKFAPRCEQPAEEKK